MNRGYKQLCYLMLITDDIAELYFGTYRLEYGKLHKDEIMADTVHRVINKALKNGAYRHWRGICKLAGDPKEDNEDNWLEFMKSDYARLLKKLDNQVQLDIGGK